MLSRKTSVTYFLPKHWVIYPLTPESPEQVSIYTCTCLLGGGKMFIICPQASKYFRLTGRYSPLLTGTCPLRTAVRPTTVCTSVR